MIVAASLANCAMAGDSPSMPTLKDAYKNDFLIGVAVNQRQFTGEDTNGVALINRSSMPSRRKMF